LSNRETQAPPAYEGMLNVSVSNSTDNIVVKWQWDNADNSKRPSGYLIKWNEKEKQLGPDATDYQIPIEDETALLVTLQTLGEYIEEYETLVKLRCQNLDKQKEEALILILKRKAELLRDIARVRKDVQENEKEISFFEDPVRHKEQKEHSKQKELKAGIRKFNQNPKKGLQLFIDNNQIQDDPKSIVQFLLHTKGLSKMAIGDLLGEPDQRYISILDEFVDALNFTNLDLVEALRSFLSKFRLPGEAQKIDRIISSFATGYTKCNPTIFTNSDTCYVVGFSIILLNTTLHNPNVKSDQRQTEERFIKMSESIDGCTIPRDLLSSYYRSIKMKPFELPEEDDQAFVNALYNPDREGFLYKLSAGRVRGWKRRWVVLTEKTLYYFDNTTDREPKGIIPLNNVQVRTCQDKNRNYCFELYQTNEGHMLTIKHVKTNPEGQVVDGNLGSKSNMIRFSAPSIPERDEWVSSIKQSLGRDPMYDYIADRRRRATFKNTQRVPN